MDVKKTQVYKSAEYTNEDFSLESRELAPIWLAYI